MCKILGLVKLGNCHGYYKGQEDQVFMGAFMGILYVHLDTFTEGRCTKMLLAAYWARFILQGILLITFNYVK